MFRVLFAKIKVKLTKKKNRFVAEASRIKVNRHEIILTLLSTMVTFLAYLIVFHGGPVIALAAIALVGNIVISKPIRTLLKSTAVAIAA